MVSLSRLSTGALCSYDTVVYNAGKVALLLLDSTVPNKGV